MKQKLLVLKPTQSLRRMSRKEGYYHGALMQYAEENEYNVEEYGKFLVGEKFIVLKHQKTEYVMSFVMTSYNDTQGAYYTLIYED